MWGSRGNNYCCACFLLSIHFFFNDLSILSILICASMWTHVYLYALSHTKIFLNSSCCIIHNYLSYFRVSYLYFKKSLPSYMLSRLLKSNCNPSKSCQVTKSSKIICKQRKSIIQSVLKRIDQWFEIRTTLRKKCSGNLNPLD